MIWHFIPIIYRIINRNVDLNKFIFTKIKLKEKAISSYMYSIWYKISSIFRTTNLKFPLIYVYSWSKKQIQKIEIEW